jgi:uncharacterized alpha-E superfamily protein
MLSRTADNLFWMARYVERAEYIARIILVGHRMSSMAKSIGNSGNEWESTLSASGCAEGFNLKYKAITARNVIDYLVSDPENSSSIVSCFQTARNNARNVRTALTVDMWDVVNSAWQRCREIQPHDTGEGLTDFMEWVKQRSLLFAGAYANTMLWNDASFFTRLGTYIERADNTARILDVKYHLLLPKSEAVGGTLDYYQWQAILRSVSAFRSYYWIYRERLQPWLVADLLILKTEMPRSLVFCTEQIAHNLDLIAARYGGKKGECHRLAGEMYAQLRYGQIDRIFQDGMHDFLTHFIGRVQVLGQEIHHFYLR